MIYQSQLEDFKHLYLLDKVEDGYLSNGSTVEFRIEDSTTVSLIVFHHPSSSYIGRLFLKIDDQYFKYAVKSCSNLEAAKRWLEKVNNNLPALMCGMREDEIL